jgi:hypothetical protein
MPLGHDGLISAPRDYLTILVVRYPRDALMTKRLFRASDRATGKTSYGKVRRRIHGTAAAFNADPQGHHLSVS